MKFKVPKRRAVGNGKWSLDIGAWNSVCVFKTKAEPLRFTCLWVMFKATGLACIIYRVSVVRLKTRWSICLWTTNFKDWEEEDSTNQFKKEPVREEKKRRKFGIIRTEIKGHTIFLSSFPKESHSLKKLNFITLTREGSPELWSCDITLNHHSWNGEFSSTQNYCK